MSIATLKEIHRYPFKSMLGESVDAIHVGTDGLLGDRSWAARDVERGSIEGARKLPALMGCRARFSAQPEVGSSAPVPEIELPDGTRLAADDPEASRRLSELAGTPLTLWPRLPANDTEHYQRGKPDNEDMLEELRGIFGRLADEPLPDISKLPPELFTSSTIPGNYFDCYPIFLLTRASLDSLQDAHPSSRFDHRRFRPNLLLDGTDTASATRDFPENDWVGKRIQVGEVIFRVAMECPRCVMTTHGFADLPKDPSVMRALVKQNGGNLGVYASVESPGIIRAGDAVEMLGDIPS